MLGRLMQLTGHIYTFWEVVRRVGPGCSCAVPVLSPRLVICASPRRFVCYAIVEHAWVNQRSHLRPSTTPFVSHVLHT